MKQPLENIRFSAVGSLYSTASGKVIKGYPISREAIAFAGLDYQVGKAPLFSKTGAEGPDFAAPNQYVTLR